MTAGTYPVELDGYHVNADYDGNLWINHKCGWQAEMPSRQEVPWGKGVDYGTPLPGIIRTALDHTCRPRTA